LSPAPEPRLKHFERAGRHVTRGVPLADCAISERERTKLR